MLLYDNARTHSVKVTQNHVATLSWDHLHHPPYSPNLTPCNFYLLPALKKNLARWCFESNAEVKQAVKRFFRTQILEFFWRPFEAYQAV
ncbi:histone-lysine N-methyltransferase SETMAR [Trichonephila clavipes]|nr:histone-lysine N-methyltransferase SETMAR [Trichonephila clavipes]